MSGFYWMLVLFLVGFGIVGIFSVGAPFLLLGIALAVIAPWRSQRGVFWPVILGVIAFIFGYLLVTPLGCRTTGAAGTAESTECDNLIGIDYSGLGAYSPSRIPALLSALAASVVTTLAMRILLTRTRRWIR